jgi:hypothetical protein
VGNAGQPRQRTPAGYPVHLMEPRVDHCSVIIGAGQVPGGGCVEQLSDWIGAGSGQQQVAASAMPARRSSR